VTDTNEVLVRRGMKKNRRREPGHITVENYW
jgi:ferredoxin--NADP+ reductase